jgi:hypothetical protein
MSASPQLRDAEGSTAEMTTPPPLVENKPLRATAETIVGNVTPTQQRQAHGRSSESPIVAPQLTSWDAIKRPDVN